MKEADQKQYKVVGSKGRLYLPRELREKAGLEEGMIVKITAAPGKLILEAVTMIEMGDHSSEAVESYVRAAVKGMEKDSRLLLAVELLEQIKES